MFNFKSLAVTAALLLTPVLASAATIPLVEGANTIVAGEQYATGGFVSADVADSLTFTLSSAAPVEVTGVVRTFSAPGSFDAFAVSAGGVTVLESPAGFYTFTFVVSPGGSEDLVLSWDGVTTGDSYSVSFSTALVPVPAAGLLLITALAGAAALRRRKAVAA